VTVVNPNPSADNDGIFTSYAALAIALIGDIKGACLLDPALRRSGEFGDLTAAAAARWIRSLRSTSDPAAPLQIADQSAGRQFTAIPLSLADGTLLGTFCINQVSTLIPSEGPSGAIALTRRLKPLLDCIQRDLRTANSAGRQVKQLTEHSADLEWLFKVTAGPHVVANNRRLLEELLDAATQRMSSELGVLFIPDKRLTILHENDIEPAVELREAWEQTKSHLMSWVQRQHKPLVVNRVGHGKPESVRCKVLCVPLVKENDRVIGTLAFFNGPDRNDFPGRQVILAQHIARQVVSIAEAQFDLMTGLYTRAGLDQMAVAGDDDITSVDSSVLYVDIDHMHVLNELHSFDLGNELIIRVADLLVPPLLPPDALAARISGDRFAVVLPNCDSKVAVTIAEQLKIAAGKIAIGPSKETFDISISTGISALLPMPDGLARAIAAAEIACKTAKNRGRNRIEVYTFEDTSMMRRHADALAVGQLRSALKQDRLLLYAQRITPLQNKSLPGGYEILLRLREADGSLVGPGPLIEAAQRYQILPSVDRWVMLRALEMLSPYRGMLKSRQLGMSINVSGQSMGDEAFIQQFTEALKGANLPKACVNLELTEQAAISNLNRAGKIVQHLGAVGCRFALDDFGTGSNSLTVLKALQIYRVKIDGSFVLDILTNRNSQATVRAIVELAKGMGIETVAEYVETMEIAQELKRLGVDYAQGYAFSRPEPLNDLLTQLASDESQRLHRLFLET